MEVSVNCQCGKPFIEVNEFGMFCEDKCNYESSRAAAKLLGPVIKEMSEVLKRNNKE